MEWTENSTRWW